MPGMMDTILNVGIDDKTYPILIEKYGKKMIDECAISFMNQFCSSKFNLEVSRNWEFVLPFNQKQLP
jgi:hypothetical protein